MKKNRILLLSIGAALLASCSTSSSGAHTITFKDSDDNTLLTLKVNDGKSIDDFISADDLSSLSSLKSGDLSVYNWFKSKNDAKQLNNGADNSNIVAFDEPIKSDLTLYPGYVYKNYDEETSSYIEAYLGSYQVQAVSSLPILYTNEIVATGINKISYKNVNEERYTEFKQDLVNEYSFTYDETTTNYYDKEGIYYLNFTYDSTNKVVDLTFTFNDKVGEFPTQFVGSMFYGLDMRQYFNEDNFSLSKNYKGEDLTKKYITNIEYSDDESSYCKYVFYTPKDSDEDPVSSINSFLVNEGMSKQSTNTYRDTFFTCEIKTFLVTSSYVSQYRELGLSVGMVGLEFIDTSSNQLDTETLAYYYNRLTGHDFDTNIYQVFDYACRYTQILTYSSSSYGYGTAFYSFGVNKDDLESSLKKMEETDWTYSKTTSGGKTAFSLLNKTQEYGLQLTFYDGSKYTDLVTNLLQVSYYHKDSVFDKINNWLTYQNVGGGKLTSMPKFEAKTYSSGYLTSGTTSIPYTYYLSGTNVTSDEYNRYVNLFKDNSEFTDVSDSTKSYLQFKYSDGFYEVLIAYSNSTLTVSVIYDGVRTFTNASDSLSYVYDRLGVKTLTVPGYDNLFTKYNDLEVSVNQYYSGKDERAIFIIPLSDSDTATSEYNTLLETFTNSDVLTKVGTSSGITFFKDSNGVYMYTYTSSSSNSLYIGMYKA